MNRTARIVVGLVVALMVAWLAGWIMGRAGKPQLESSMEGLQLRLLLTEARGRLLEARVDLYNVNFGNATRRFEDAKVALRSASERLTRVGPDTAGAQVSTAIQQIDAAEALAHKLDQAANTRAAEAVSATDAALAALK